MGTLVPTFLWIPVLEDLYGSLLAPLLPFHEFPLNVLLLNEEGRANSTQGGHYTPGTAPGRSWGGVGS